MTIQETSTAGGTPAATPESHRKSRSDATPLESHRQTILAWIETENCSYQECCKRLKEQFDIDCSPKVLCTHRQQWATESELETST
jgi:transposase